MRFEVFYDHQDRRWHWVFKDVHGSIIAVPYSGGFVEKELCLASIQVVQRSMQARTVDLPPRNLPKSED